MYGGALGSAYARVFTVLYMASSLDVLHSFLPQPLNILDIIDISIGQISILLHYGALQISALIVDAATKDRYGREKTLVQLGLQFNISSQSAFRILLLAFRKLLIWRILTLMNGGICRRLTSLLVLIQWIL